MTAPNDIVIDDLADPRITPAIAAAREGPADFPADIDVDGILARASAMTGGLTDFGEDTGFRERLAVVIQSLAEDEGLTRGGRITILDHAVRVMANRLRIEELVKQHPEILDITIDRVARMYTLRDERLSESARRVGLDAIVFFGDAVRLRGELRARGVNVSE